MLAEIGALHVPTLEVYNKIDLVDYLSEGFDREHDGVIRKVRISAVEKRGLDILLRAIAERLANDVMSGCLRITAQQARERALLYDIGVVETEKIDSDGNWLLDVRMQKQDWNRFCKKFNGLENSLIK